MGKPRKTIRRKKMVAASSSGNFFQFLGEAMEVVKEKWHEILIGDEETETQQKNQNQQTDQRILPLFSHKESNNLNSLSQKESKELGLLLDFYRDVYLLYQCPKSNPENLRDHKKAFKLGRQIKRQKGRFTPSITAYQEFVALYQGVKADGKMLERGYVYGIVTRFLQKDDFWTLMQRGAYLDIVTIDRLKKDCQQKLPLAHYPTKALIFLTTYILPLIEEKIEQYQAELRTKEKTLTKEFFNAYKQHLEICVKKIVEQKQLIYKSLSNRFSMSVELGDLACDDVLFVMCQRILKAVEENKEPQDGRDRIKGKETNSSLVQENINDTSANRLIILCKRILMMMTGDKQESRKKPENKKAPPVLSNAIAEALKELRWVVNGSPRSSLATSDFKEVYAYLISASTVALAKNKKELPLGLDNCYKSLKSWCNDNTNRLELYGIYNLRKKTIILPKHYQAFIPKAPRWPASWFKGHTFRYNFSENYLYDLVTIDSEIASLRTRVTECDNKTGDAKLVGDMLYAFDVTRNRYREMKQEISKHRVSGWRKLFYRKTNAFLNQWENDIDSLRVNLLKVQMQYIEKQIKEVNNTLKAFLPLGAVNNITSAPLPKIESISELFKGDEKGLEALQRLSSKNFTSVVEEEASLPPIKLLYGVFESVEKELRAMPSSLLHTKFSASIKELIRVKKNFLSLTDIGTYFVKEYQRLELVTKNAENGVPIDYIQKKDIEKLKSRIKDLHRGDQQNVFESINFICELLLNNKHKYYYSLTMKKLQEKLQPLFSNNAEARAKVLASDLIERIILPSISTTTSAAFHFIKECRPDLARKREDIINPVGDRYVTFIKEVMRLELDVYLKSINSTPKGKQRHILTIDGKEMEVTLENIDKAISFIENSFQKQDHKKSLQTYLKKYVKKYTGADNVFQKIFILFGDKPVIRSYGEKLFNCYLRKKQYKELLEEPFFSEDNPYKDRLAGTLGKCLFEHIKEHTKVTLGLIPIIDKSENKECKQKYNRLYLTTVLLDRAFYFREQKRMNKYLFVDDDVKPADIFGESYLPDVINQLRKFIEEYNRQPYPKILPLIKSYFTPEFVEKYQLAELKSRLNTLCESHELRTQGLEGHDAKRRIKTLIENFDCLLVTSKAADIDEAQERLLRNIRSAETPAERKQGSQTKKTTYPVLSRFTDYMITQLIYRTLTSEAGYKHIRKLLDTKLQRGEKKEVLNTGQKLKVALPQRVEPFNSNTKTTLDFVLNHLKRTFHVSDNRLNLAIMVEDLVLLPYIFKGLEVGLKEIVNHREGISLNIDETVLVLLYHWPTGFYFNNRDFRNTASSAQTTEIFKEDFIERIYELRNRITRAKKAVEVNHPLHTILTALDVVSKRGVLSEHECQLLQGFERFKTVINQITCICGVEYEHSSTYSLKKVDIELLMNKGYGDKRYREFWQHQINHVIQQGRIITITELIRNMGSEEQKQQLAQFTASVLPEECNRKSKEVDRNPTPVLQSNGDHDRMFKSSVATEAKRLLLRDRYEHKQRMSKTEVKDMVNYYIDHDLTHRQSKPAKELEKYTNEAKAYVKMEMTALSLKKVKKTRKQWFKNQTMLMNACYLLASQNIHEKEHEIFMDELLLQYMSCMLTRLSKPFETSSTNANNIVALVQVIETLGSTNQVALCQYWQQLFAGNVLELDDPPNLLDITLNVKGCYDLMVEVINDMITTHLQTKRQPTKNQSSSSGLSSLTSLLSSFWSTDPRVVSERTNACLQKVLSQLKAVQRELNPKDANCGAKQLISAAIQGAETQLKGITLPETLSQGLMALFQHAPIILQLQTESTLTSKTSPMPRSQLNA